MAAPTLQPEMDPRLPVTERGPAAGDDEPMEELHRRLLDVAASVHLQPEWSGRWESGEAPLPRASVLRSRDGDLQILVADTEADPRAHEADLGYRSLLCVPVNEPIVRGNTVVAIMAAINWLRAWPDAVFKALLLYPQGTALFAYQPLLVEAAKRNVGALVLPKSTIDADTPDELAASIYPRRVKEEGAPHLEAAPAPREEREHKRFGPDSDLDAYFAAVPGAR